MKPSRLFRGILWLLACVIVLAVLAGLALVYGSSDVIRYIAGDKASGKLGRDFAIDGPVAITWDWDAPEIRLSKIRLANLPNRPDPNMVSIDELDFHIKIWQLFAGQLNLPDITIKKPILVFEKIDPATKNWEFPAMSQANAATKVAVPSERGTFPIIGQIAIENGKLTYRDLTKKLDVTLGINTATGGGGTEGVFELNGKGNLQDKPFDLTARGGSLGMLRNSKEKYPLHVHLKMDQTEADINGTFLDPVQMEGVDTTLDIKGDSLANLFYLIFVPLPPTPAYALSGHLTKTGNVWNFNDFKGKVGGSDLEGNLSYDLTGDRGLMKADLTSSLLDMKDLAGFGGATPAPRAGDEASQRQIDKAAAEKASPKLLPDVPLDLTRLRSADMDVTLKAEKILAPGLPMNNLDIRFLLKDGVLRLDPLNFGIAQGNIAGSLVLDGSKETPHVVTDLGISKLNIKQFFKNTEFESETKGLLGGRFAISGDGKSLAEVLAGSNGRVTFVIGGGSLSELIVDGAGLDIGNAAGVLLGKDKPTNLRCAVADFNDKDGRLDSNVFVVDTNISNIAGDAHINLKDESIDGKIEATPKSPTITAHAPITFGGQLKHPSVALDVKETAARGTAAAVMSVFLTPLAAVIPFISAGVGEDSDCADLVKSARSAAPPPATPANKSSSSETNG